MSAINFKHGALIKGGPKKRTGGKWDAILDDTVRSAHRNADLTILIRVFFHKIDVPKGQVGLYPDADDQKSHPSKRHIQPWQPNEFEHFAATLVQTAQKFWTDAFWLRTPSTYSGLDWPDHSPSHRCQLRCLLELSLSKHSGDAHYTIPVVRVQDSEKFRSHSLLYTQRDIAEKILIPHSKYWVHYHEVGHLLGLGHVGHNGHRNVHHDNSPKAYGITAKDKADVMGMGSTKHTWHALPWRDAAAALTNTAESDWHVFMGAPGSHITPTSLKHHG